jgi:hypothetical protein
MKQMNILLLQWGLFSFMIGIVLSLPLAAVYYQKESLARRIFTNARKLKSAHLDYFMQAFAVGVVYLLELATKSQLPLYVVIPLIYGTIMNPTIFLLEATPYIRSGIMRFVYQFLKATSPALLLFAWFAIAFLYLPLFLKISLLAVVAIGLILYGYHYFQVKKQGKNHQTTI